MWNVLFQGTHFCILLNNWEQRKVWRSEACRDLCGAIRRKSLSTIWGWGGPLCPGTEWLSECGADGEVRESSAREVCNTEHASGPGLQHALVLVGQVWMMIWRVLSCSPFCVLKLSGSMPRAWELLSEMGDIPALSIPALAASKNAQAKISCYLGSRINFRNSPVVLRLFDMPFSSFVYLDCLNGNEKYEKLNWNRNIS